MCKFKVEYCTLQTCFNDYNVKENSEKDVQVHKDIECIRIQKDQDVNSAVKLIHCYQTEIVMTNTND